MIHLQDECASEGLSSLAVVIQSLLGWSRSGLQQMWSLLGTPDVFCRHRRAKDGWTETRTLCEILVA